MNKILYLLNFFALWREQKRRHWSVRMLAHIVLTVGIEVIVGSRL